METLIGWAIIGVIFYLVSGGNSKKTAAKPTKNPTPTAQNPLEDVIRQLLQPSASKTTSSTTSYEYSNVEVIKAEGEQVEKIYQEGRNPERNRKNTTKEPKKQGNKKPKTSKLPPAIATTSSIRRSQISRPTPNPIAESLREREMLKRAFIASEIFKRKF